MLENIVAEFIVPYHPIKIPADVCCYTLLFVLIGGALASLYKIYQTRKIVSRINEVKTALENGKITDSEDDELLMQITQPERRWPKSYEDMLE